MTDQTFGKNRRSILLLITAGLVLMLVSTLSYFSANPGLVSHTTTGTQAAAPSGQQMPTSAGMDEATQQGVMALMQKLQKNPTDLEALVGLTEHFMHTQDWQRAETFALRAVVAAPNETQRRSRRQPRKGRRRQGRSFRTLQPRHPLRLLPRTAGQGPRTAPKGAR